MTIELVGRALISVSDMQALRVNSSKLQYGDINICRTGGISS